MYSLQYLSTKKLLEQIPINTETSAALDDFIIRYLDTHSQPMDYLMEHKTLFQVFFRTRDTSTDYENNFEGDGVLVLLKTFINLDTAIKWIYNNGKNIVNKLENEYDQPIVLTIVTTNDTLYDPDEYIIPPGISQKEYLTYAFSPLGWEMIKDEYGFSTIDREVVIPYWLTYISNGIIYRYSTEDLSKLYDDIDVSFNYEEKEKELLTFLKNPNKYIKNHMIV
jgi:hypothetical protein